MYLCVLMMRFPYWGEIEGYQLLILFRIILSTPYYLRSLVRFTIEPVASRTSKYPICIHKPVIDEVSDDVSSHLH